MPPNRSSRPGTPGPRLVLTRRVRRLRAPPMPPNRSSRPGTPGPRLVLTRRVRRLDSLAAFEIRPSMIADVAFDVPVDHPFSYRVPDGWSLTRGQRVFAPLRGAPRPGVVVDVRDGTDERLKLLSGIDESSIVVGAEQLALARWIAAESLSSLGSTLAALTSAPRLPATS